MQLEVKWYSIEVCTFRYVAWVYFNVSSTYVWVLTSFVEKITFWTEMSHIANPKKYMKEVCFLHLVNGLDTNYICISHREALKESQKSFEKFDS
jgi:heptaprenylglyceryl phosphate synthase